MTDPVFFLLQEILAVITLVLGGALIIFIYDSYRIVKQPTLLIFTVGLFILVVGLVLPDMAMIVELDEQGTLWISLISRIVEISGIGLMNYAVLR